METVRVMRFWRDWRSGFALAILVLLPVLAGAQTRYRVEDLSTVQGGGAAQSVTRPRAPALPTLHDHRSPAQWGQAQTSPSTDERIALFKFVSIDVPNATGTLASDINPRGEIVGAYFDASSNSHGFLLRHGKFTTIDVPGSLVGVPGMLWTEANGINPSGDIVGDYFAPPGAPGAPECQTASSPACRRGFLYSHGQFSDVLVPGKKGSIANGITPDGTIYGCGHDDDYLASMFGFARTPPGTYTTLSVPASMNNGATPDGKIVVGLYVDPPDQNGIYHGSVVQDGLFSPYDVPGSTFTLTWEINPAADFVGYYGDANGNQHGFLQRWGEPAPTSIDVPSGPPFNSTWTNVFGINSEGALVGLYADSAGTWHGFLAIPQEPDQAPVNKEGAGASGI